VDFLRNGVLADPYAIRYVEIYKSQVVPHNLVATVPILDPDDPLYPSPLCQDEVATDVGDCGTEPTEPVEYLTGKYHLPYLVPEDFVVPDVYFDVWYYFPTDPCLDITPGTGGCDLDAAELESLMIKCCHRFWIYPDEWFCDDALQTIRFGFEPLDQKFHSPESRPLEIGLMPLPLYDYNFNLVNPIIPFLRPTITIETRHCELLVDQDPADIAVRHGSFRSNPWVVKYMLDTTRFLKGTYTYFITLNLPDGSTRVSRKFIFTIS
jgi:hypothetical protein